MIAGLVPAALLVAALGLALARARHGVRVPSLLALFATLAGCSFAHPPETWLEVVFCCCWVAVIATAASVHLARGLGLVAALVLSVNAGIWASAVLSMSGSHLDLLKAVSLSMIVVPAAWVARRYDSVPLKVVSSWVIAVAVLALSLQLLPVTPGYLPDHLE